MKIRVECYSGRRVNETPRRIFFGQRKIEVQSLLDRWLSPNHRYFKFTGDDDALYIIRHDSQSQSWELTLYRMKDVPPAGKTPPGTS